MTTQQRTSFGARWRRGVGLALVGIGTTAAIVAPPGPAAPAPRRVASRAFHASGGSIVAVVTVAGRFRCEVELLGPGGSVLARAISALRPVTLSTSEPSGADLAVLVCPRSTTVPFWQAEITGAGP